MRVLFFLLLLANAGVLWLLQPSITGTEPERIAQQLNPERLTVLEREPQRPVAPPEPAGTCLEAGEFTARNLPEFEAELAQLALGVLPKKQLWRSPPQHIVYLPPQASEAAAGRRLAQLREMGFADSAVIRDEPTRRWGISLGLFTRLDLAESQLEKIHAAGVSDARVAEYPFGSARYGYRLAGLDEPGAERLRTLVSGLPGITLRGCD